MTFLEKLRKRLSIHKPVMAINPEQAYDLWAQQYDAQPDNLMLILEAELFTDMLEGEILTGKKVVDIGCGTGRHWEEMLRQSPADIMGYDVSAGMLAKLNIKYPAAVTYQLSNNRLTGLADKSCDVIVSTLTLAHIEDVRAALNEWNRVLKPGGEIILTDYHPTALANNGDRTFVYHDRLISIKNYVHPIEKILSIILPLDIQVVSWNEKVIDDSLKHYYEEKNALHVFEKFRNVPIVYGMHLKKRDGTA